MSLWLLIVLLGVIKLPLAALMLWLPLRHDEAMRTQQLPDRSDDDGGTRALPASALDPRPRHPGGDRPRAPWRGPARSERAAPSARRDPHRERAPQAPRRVRA